MRTVIFSIEGRVKFSDYLWYWKSQGIVLFFIFLLFMAFGQCTRILANIWLSKLSGDPTINATLDSAAIRYGNRTRAPDDTMTNTSSSSVLFSIEDYMSILNLDEKQTIISQVRFYMLIYLLIGFLVLLFSAIYSGLYVLMIIRACRTIHSRLLGTPSSFKFCY